ncbi:hypothetical protein D3C81_1681220 [compost metagenome]
MNGAAIGGVQAVTADAVRLNGAVGHIDLTACVTRSRASGQLPRYGQGHAGRGDAPAVHGIHGMALYGDGLIRDINMDPISEHWCGGLGCRCDECRANGQAKSATREVVDIHRCSSQLRPRGGAT